MFAAPTRLCSLSPEQQASTGTTSLQASKALIQGRLRGQHLQLREAHVEDHRELYNRVQLHVVDSSRPPAAKNPVLSFNYSRYRLIASSRKGGQPCTLGGGMWNDSVRPPWSYNYTINENTQKQYAHI